MPALSDLSSPALERSEGNAVKEAKGLPIAFITVIPPIKTLAGEPEEDRKHELTPTISSRRLIPD